MTNKLYRWFVAGIILLAVFFRFYQFPTIPPSLNWDEVAYGYNAYSILKTGKDEYGKSFPLYFRSLDDYKLPVQTYSIVGSIALFGYNDFAVRFPSALAGVGSVLLLIFLGKELFKRKEVGLVAGFFMAVAPWNVQYSRMAAEANIAFFFFLLGTLALLKAQKRSWALIVSAVGFSLSMFSYLSFRVICPLVGVGLLAALKKQIPWKSKSMVVAAILVVLVGGYVLSETVFGGMHIRFTGTNVFGMYEPYKKAEDEMFYDATLGINIPRRIFHDNKLATTIPLVLRGYLTHFSPDNLFFDLDQKHHHAPNVGLLYWWILPFLFLGFYWILKNEKRQTSFLVLLWLLVSPVAASLTWDIPNALRTIGMSGPFHLLTAAGIVGSIFWMQRTYKKAWWKLYALILFGTAVFFAFHFFHQYFIHFPQERSDQWVYGRKEMTKVIEEEKGNYKKIIVSTNLEWPYIFMLYYSQYNPETYISQGGTVSGGWGEQFNHYDTYEFRKFTMNEETQKNELLVGKPEEFPGDITPLFVIPFRNGKPAIYIVAP